MKVNTPPENEQVTRRELLFGLLLVTVFVVLLVLFVNVTINPNQEDSEVSIETTGHDIIGGFIVNPEPNTICKINILNTDGTVEAACYSERTIDPASGTYISEDNPNYLEVSTRFQKSQCL